MKGIEHAIKKTAIDSGIPEDQVRMIVERYWQEVYSKMVKGMDDGKTTLFLRNIGMFTISKFKLTNFIKKRIDKIRGMRKSDKYTDEQKKEFEKNQFQKLELSLKYRNLVARDYAEKFGNV